MNIERMILEKHSEFDCIRIVLTFLNILQMQSEHKYGWYIDRRICASRYAVDGKNPFFDSLIFYRVSPRFQISIATMITLSKRNLRRRALTVRASPNRRRWKVVRSTR